MCWCAGVLVVVMVGGCWTGVREGGREDGGREGSGSGGDDSGGS